MNIWIGCVSEPLPIDKGGQRKMRAGMLTSTLAARGHRVTWWTSAFNHSAKRHRVPRSTSVHVDGIDLRLLWGRSYSKNVSVARLVNNYQVAREFSRLAELESKPDLIFCCWPTIELGYAAIRYGLRNSIPVILDVRDLWPDLFLDAAPAWLHGPAKTLLAPYYRMTRFAFARAAAIVGISEQYFQWGLSCAGRPRMEKDALFPLGYPAMDLREPTPQDRERFRAMGIDDSRLLYWFLGSFADTYDLDTVIRVARRLKDQGMNDCQFVLSGEGEKRAQYEKMAAGLDNVVFTGWMNGADIACMMRLAHVGLAAYRKGAPQGLPNKIFEYMSAGLPILSSLADECERFLQANDCGMSYKAGDPDSLLDALAVLRENPGLRARLGSNGLREFRNRYAAPVLYSQLSEYLENFRGSETDLRAAAC